jgi:competence protein ComEA
MTRPQAIAVVLVLAGALGVFAWWRVPVEAAPTSCPDGGALRLGPDGVARCGDGAPLPAGQALTLKQKFDCNTATAEDFALVPGIGPSLAQDLVAARDGGFRDWAELDAVPGVGAARLIALQAACDIRVADAGVW